MAQESSKTSYVLGTGDDELHRLREQHAIWRSVTMDCWQRAGITTGSQVIDIGAGPGFATADLAAFVGPTGKVYSWERSLNFSDYLKDQKSKQGWQQVEVTQLDLLQDEFPEIHADFAWCRWVCIFLSQPELLIRKLKRVLKPRGKVIFFEYMAYESWRMIPGNASLDRMVARVMDSWRSQGSDPDVALRLIPILTEAGFHITSTTPHLYAPTPRDPFFAWLGAFIRVNTARTLASGEISPGEASELLLSLQTAELNPNTVMITPTVLEIIAQAP